MAVTADSGMVPTRPVWLDPEEQSFPTLDRDLSVEVAIIGGGITGVACARWLGELGAASVAVLESRTVAAGASGRNAGFVMAVAPENFPATENAADVEVSRRIWEFTDQNQRMIEAAIDEFGLDAEYRKLGSLGLAAHPEEWDWIRSSTEVARACGLKVELADRVSLESEWLKRNYLGGAWYPDNAEMHPAKFVRGLARVLADRGAHFFERSPVTALDWWSNPDYVDISCGTHIVRAERVIVAANAYAATVLPDAGAHISPTRGQVLTTAPLDRIVAKCPVYANDGFQYWRQRPDGRVVLGGWRDLDFGAEVGLAENLNLTIQDRLTEVAEGLCGGEVPIEYRWSGIMGFTKDRRPLVGRLPGESKVAICAGFSGHGLAMAMHSARVAVDDLLDRPTHWTDLFAPGRFLSSQLSEASAAEPSTMRWF